MLNRRNFYIRAVAGLTGEITVGIALAGACMWIIEIASLGVFLSFLLWLLAALLAFAISQHAVHPAVEFVLADDKLDRGLGLIHGIAIAVSETGPADFVRQGLTRFARRAA